MSNDENKFQPIFQILHIKSTWFLLELAMALVSTIGMRFLQVWSVNLRNYWCIQISPKANQILDRFLPHEARAEICQTFGLFRRFEDTKILFSD